MSSLRQPSVVGDEPLPFVIEAQAAKPTLE